MFAQRAELAATLARVLEPIGEVRLALLFGSRARGDAGASSDVDLVVDAPGASLGMIAARVCEAVDLEADIIQIRDVSIPLQRELIRDSIVVYERRPGAAAAWRSRVLAQLETDGPWYDRMRNAWLAGVAKHGLKNG